MQNLLQQTVGLHVYVEGERVMIEYVRTLIDHLENNHVNVARDIAMAHSLFPDNANSQYQFVGPTRFCNFLDSAQSPQQPSDLFCTSIMTQLGYLETTYSAGQQDDSWPPLPSDWQCPIIIPTQRGRKANSELFRLKMAELRELRFMSKRQSYEHLYEDIYERNVISDQRDSVNQSCSVNDNLQVNCFCTRLARDDTKECLYEHMVNRHLGQSKYGLPSSHWITTDIMMRCIESAWENVYFPGLQWVIIKDNHVVGRASQPYGSVPGPMTREYKVIFKPQTTGAVHIYTSYPVDSPLDQFSRPFTYTASNGTEVTITNYEC